MKILSSLDQYVVLLGFGLRLCISMAMDGSGAFNKTARITGKLKFQQFEHMLLFLHQLQ